MAIPSELSQVARALNFNKESNISQVSIAATVGVTSVGIATTLPSASLDVYGQSELDDVNISGFLTATSANFSGNVTVGGILKYEDVVNVDSVGIATARSGLRVTAGGLDVVGLATFNDGVATIDVIGHTELDDLNVSGVTTFVGIVTASSGLRVTAGGLDVVGIATFNDGVSNIDVIGHTELDNLNVSGVSTFVGIVTSQDKVFVGTDLSVAGDARIVGVLTVGSSSITLDGDNNTINVGSSVEVNNSGFTVGTSTITSTEIRVDNVIVGVLTAGVFIAETTTVTDVAVTGVITATGLRADFSTISGPTETDTLNVTGVGTISTLYGNFDGELNAPGKTYYVSTTGSDSNSGDNLNQPFLTISQALSVASNGDIIEIFSGTYEETAPLTVPRGVTVKGSGIRATTIKPSDATKTNNIFLLNDVSTVEDFTIRNSYYDSSADTGYAFAYAPGIAITTRSPYVQRITVLNTGSSISVTDPYGYDTADNPPTTYIAGRGALVDGSLVASNSLEAGMLFNEVTFFTPNSKGIILTNGARAEYLNCFHYFASQAIVGLGGTVGIAGTAETRLKFRTPSVTPAVNDVVKLYEGGSVVAVGTITNYNDPYARISGKGYGTFTSVGIGTTQDVRFFQSDGTTQTGIASAISLADYKMFGAEMRSVGCAVEYGSQGVVADGLGVNLRLFATNFNHVGSGKDFTNDPTTVIQANEVIELNDGQVSYVSIDQKGDFRVGESFIVDQENGSVSFAATTYSLETTGTLTVTDGGSNQSEITPTSLTVGNLQLSANTFSSVSGDITLDPANAGRTIVSGDFSVTGVSTFTGAIDIATITVDGHSELNNVNVSGIVTAFDLDVEGHSELDNLNVSGVSTFVGVTTTQSDAFIGNNLNVAGDARIIGILTVGSSSITFNGDTNTVNIGTGVTLHTTTSSFNQIEVSGVSTFSGITTFTGGVFAPSLNVTNLTLPGGTLGEDVSTRNLDVSGISTVLGAFNASGDVTVTGILTVGQNTITIDGDNNFITVGTGVTIDGNTGIISATSLHVGAEGYGIRVTNDTISGPATLNIDPSAVGDNTGLVVIKGDLQIDGTTTTVNSTTVTVDDKNILLGSGAANDAAADGGGITLESGDGNKTFNWIASTDSWTSSENIDIASGNTFKINTADVLSASTLGSGVVNSSLTTVGALLGLNVTGVSTFANNIDANGDLDVEGHTELDNVNISGIVTTFDLDVDGHTELDNINVSGVSTFVGVSTFQNNLYVSGSINSSTAVNVNGVSVVQSAVDEALALAIALG